MAERPHSKTPLPKAGLVKRERNVPLLARPPEGIHGLGVAGGRFFESVVGRPTKPEDYHGVHTSGSEEIAGVYAIGAWTEAKARDPGAYPVVLTLDVSGLRAVPDVDAIAQAAFLLADTSVRSQFEGEDLDSAGDQWELDYDHLRVGADTNSAVIESVQYGSGPMAAFDDDESWDRWVRTGNYTEDEAIRLVDQRRYLDDFDWARVVEARAMKPWWPQLLDEPWDDESEARLKAAEATGHKVLTVQDVGFTDLIELQPIAKGGGAPGDVQYHGTSSWHLARAFPEIKVPPSPFPLRAENPAKARLLSY